MTISNISPWLKQLRRTRPIINLKENACTDIAIVGGGISGVATAYFLLRDTNKSVILLERNKIAHGATGHNGGQIVAAIETPISELAKIFGYSLISEGLKAIDSSWNLFYSIIDEMGIEIELQIVSTCLALSVADAHFMLEESRLRKQLGLPWDDILLAEDAAEDIPDDFAPLFRKVSRKVLEELILTHDKRYICALVGKSGLINTALFCEELVKKLLEKYSGRFRVYEKTAIQKIELGKENLLRTSEYELKAQLIVLCTNGYTDLEINGINVSLKRKIERILGYMAGYLDEKDLQPTSTVYFSPHGSSQPSGYFYLTRRKYLNSSKRSLTCMGGPNKSLRNEDDYHSEDVQNEHEYARIDEFYRRTVIDKSLQRDFSWNGLMGYTSGGIRLIGPDPANASLFYNLGCNGIGILPSIYGGKRIAQFINEDSLKPSIFDPR